MVEGDRVAMKLTTPMISRSLNCCSRKAPTHDRPVSGAVPCGTAFDIHAHADDPDRVLVLGGVSSRASADSPVTATPMSSLTSADALL